MLKMNTGSCMFTLKSNTETVVFFISNNHLRLVLRGDSCYHKKSICLPFHIYDQFYSSIK